MARPAKRPRLEQLRGLGADRLPRGSGPNLIRWPDGATVWSLVRGDSLELTFTMTPYGGEPESIAQDVSLVSVPCRFGGTRRVFVCPCCWARRRSLYLYGTRFVCRACTGAQYASRRMNGEGRAGLAILRLHRRLQWDTGTYFDYPDKPPGMWGRTYERLMARLTDAQLRYDDYLGDSLERAAARFGGLA